jgi:aryl-alcohol dehydrogenase-like predicted oxidoreductase
VQTRRLGTTDAEVSALCLGTMYFGSRTDEEASWELLDRYYEAGGRFLDTANKYATWVEDYDEPKSEPLLGEWIEERGVREELTIATKVGFPYPGVPRGLDPGLVEEEVEKSLDRLSIETIDLLYVHGDDYDTPQESYMRALHGLVEAGKVQHLGASNVFAWRLARANQIAAERGLTPFSCLQPRFSYLIPDRGADFGRQVPATDELVDYADRNGLTLVPFSPLLKGVYGRDDREIPAGYVRTENRLKMDLVRELAAEYGVGGNQIVLAWMAQRDPPIVPLFGASTPEQLEANVVALDVDLSTADRERLDGIEELGDVNR